MEDGLKIKHLLRRGLVIMLIPIVLYSCLWVVALAHDNWPTHYESKLSLMKNPEAVQIMLENNLPKQTKQSAVLLFLEQQKIHDCVVDRQEIHCWVPTRDPAINPDNPVEIVLPNLLFSGESYHIIFEFRNDELYNIKTTIHRRLP